MSRGRIGLAVAALLLAGWWPCRGLRFVLDERPSFACLGGGPACPDGVEEAAGALAVLAHEAVHLAGVVDEGVTECRARQEVAGVAARLGLSAAAGAAVARWQALERQERLPRRYREASC